MTGQAPNPVEDTAAREATAPDLDPAAAPRAASRAGWAIAALLLVEYTLFRQFALREIVWAYPLGSDQTGYLTLSYLAHEDILARGLIPGFLDSVRRPLPNSFLIHVEANLLFLLLGPSRLSALTLNFLYFAGLQVVFAGTLRWLARRWSFAFFGLGLLLAVQTPFFLVGGMADFRADFGAFCLFGIFMSLVVRSGVFADRRWSAVAGLSAALLVLYRFLTTVYLIGIVGLVLVWCLVRMARAERGSSERARARRQLGGLLVAGMAFALLAAPAFWQNRRAIWQYYVLPEAGPEKAIRQALAGIRGLRDVLLFYPDALTSGQLTAPFWVLAGVSVGAFWILGRAAARVRRGAPLSPPACDRASAAVFAAACLAVPLVVLTLVPIKFQLLASVCVPPVLWLLMLLLARLWPQDPRPGAPPLYERAAWALAAGAVAVGLLTHFAEFGARTVFSRSRADVAQILHLYDAIGEQSARMGWTAPRLFVDMVSDSINWAVPFPLLYERHHRVLRTSPSVGGIWPVAESDALAALEQSDFVVLTLAKPPGSSLYPFDHSMDLLRPTLKAVCDRDFLVLATFRAYGQELALYARPSLRLDGDSAGWITADGLTLSGDSGAVRAYPRIELRGTSDFRFLPPTLRVSAEATVGSHDRRSVAARTVVSGQRYRIVLELDPRTLPEHAPLEIRVRFGDYFVPKQLGTSEDARKLVLRTPDEVRLLRRD